MTTTNNITGDLIKSRHNSDKYASNYDAIFNKKPEPEILNPCKACGSVDLALVSATGSHYSMDYVVCLKCKREGNGELSIADAHRAWNKANP